ncbi:MAG: type I DNA topoisomerase, partial [Planctomycetes bacterium]|nr:type I DNA topoisomerase [Planctomycetota bacterium]
MEKALVIVESPAKAKTIGRYLGKGFAVLSSMGHLRDLPRGALGIDIERGFEAEYAILPEKERIVEEIGRAVRRAGEVYLALDRDREGEAIAWHIRELFSIPEERCRRVVFNEITPRAIREAFDHPGPIETLKVEAQQARRALDRVVGYKLSPLIWEKILKGLSAGRVQSVAVKLIVDREREIRAFRPREYWTIRVDLRTPRGDLFQTELRTIEGRSADLAAQGDAEGVARALREATARVASLVTREKEEPPPPPFTTSRLQQEASTRLSFSPQRTMRIAQQLYEGIEIPGEGSVGLITYMRTDSVRVADEAVAEVRDVIAAEFGSPYVPETPVRHANRKGAQEAHEAIRPTLASRAPASVEGALSPEQAKLYGLIWRQFVASQMAPARYRTTRLEIEAGPCGLASTGRATVFDGFRRVLPLERATTVELPPVEEGEALHVVDVLPTQHFTQPPKRFTEASLIRALEKEGIGRPSTYATIL